MKKILILVLGLCFGFNLTANADCCTPKNLRVTCSDADGVVSISWENNCNTKDCVHGLFTSPNYEVTITGSISRSYTTKDKFQGNTSDMYLPRGGSITVTVKCLQHRDQITASCTRTSTGSIDKPCAKPLPNVSGYFYTYYVESIRAWKMMCYLTVTNKTGSETPHSPNCRVWFYTNEGLTNCFYDGYSGSGSWEIELPSSSSWYGNTVYVKVIPADRCAVATTEHYWVGRAQITSGQAGTFYFTFTEVCRPTSN